jgi:hypothetical protein
MRYFICRTFPYPDAYFRAHDLLDARIKYARWLTHFDPVLVVRPQDIDDSQEEISENTYRAYLSGLTGREYPPVPAPRGNSIDV